MVVVVVVAAAAAVVVAVAAVVMAVVAAVVIVGSRGRPGSPVVLERARVGRSLIVSGALEVPRRLRHVTLLSSGLESGMGESSTRIQRTSFSNNASTCFHTHSH